MLLGILVVGVLVSGPRHAASAPADPAARGLDVLVHLPRVATAEASLPVQIQAYGFASVDRPAPLPNATIEAVWDPESLGEALSKAPAAVRAETDAEGRTRLLMPVPAGAAHGLRLLVSVRHGEHERTRTVNVERRGPSEISLQVAERRVVPGSWITAWVLARSAASGRPLAGATIELALLEGGLARFSTRLTTDTAGSAVGRVPIPRVGTARWSWTLVAREAGEATKDAARDEVTLGVRDETPGTATLLARCERPAVRAGESVECTLRLRDAANAAVASAPLRYWWGPKGTTPPTDPKLWLKASTSATTDSVGEVALTLHAPTTVAPVVGTRLDLVARTRLDGRDLEAKEQVEVRHAIPNVALLVDGGALIGGVEQHALLRVRDESDKPVVARFRVQADGLDLEAQTDPRGEADVAWRVPKDVGAYRSVGPCAENVAAAVRVTPLGDVEAFGRRREPFELCVQVDRDAPAMMRVTPLVVTAGERVQVRIEPGHRPWSVVARAVDGDMATSTWIADGAQGAELTIPAGASGPWALTAISPGQRRPSDVLSASVLVRPALLPRLDAQVTGGRIVPGGSAWIDVQLSDAQGKGLAGTVAALVQDRFGGGSLRGLERLDTRTRLCAALAIERERCDELLEGDASVDPLRRGLLGQLRPEPVVPVLDPAAQVDETLRTAFRAVVHSLEGAVLEATESPERLRDARRRGTDGRWTFNPELWTLVTAAMAEPPRTPGGELLGLPDLVSLDDQVRFDNVARRVTRLKIFRALAAVREQVRDQQLTPGEPALRDPAALLRRLVRAGTLSESDLLDPWGGTLGFVAGGRDGLPFLTLRGFELRSPGPDGRLGNGDDVSDPFERVLRSKTPYAEAVGEDELVDARLDMRVADATVDGWRELIERLTGTSLGGRGEGIGLGSIGTMGHGSGSGSGHGYGSGRGRLGRSTNMVGARWVLPARTDANGRIRIEVPLGDEETTWQVGLVGLADHGEGAVAMVEVPVSLPLSARVETGGDWIVGDVIDVRITARNRTAAAINAQLDLAPNGAIELLRPAGPSWTVSVPAQGAAEATVRVRALRAGPAELEVHTRSQGVGEDRYRHQWTIRPRGEPTDVVQMAWVDGEATVSLPAASPNEPWTGPGRLLVARGHQPLLAAALEALEPDLLRTPDALANAQAAALAIRRSALTAGGEDSALVRRSLDVARRALGRLAVHAAEQQAPAAWKQLAAMNPSPEFAAVIESFRSSLAECPPESAARLPEALEWLEVERPGPAGASLACWDQFVADTVERVIDRGDPEQLALAVLGLADASHRAPVTASLVARLERAVGLQPSGWLKLSAAAAASRSTRTLIYAALLRAAALGMPVAASSDRLVGWLALGGGARGGYGSARATRAAVQAMLAMTGPASTAVPRVTLVEGGAERVIELDPSGQATVTLAPSPAADSVLVRTSGAPALVRLERRKLRPWTRLPATSAPPLGLELDWPAPQRAGAASPLRITLQNGLGRPAAVEVRLPLPAGARLAAPLKDVRQIQGVLSVVRRLESSDVPTVIDVPIRFALRGTMTVPEAYATLVDEEAERVVAPARPITVR